MTDKTDRIEAYAKTKSSTIPNNGVFYTWGGDHHHTMAFWGIDRATFDARYNQPVGGGANGGPGLYLSMNVHDSATYCAENNGCLLEVTVPDDMPYIDYQDTEVMNDLKSGDPKIIGRDLFANGDDKPKILLRFTGTWLALKTRRGVQFRIFDGRSFRNNMAELKAQVGRLTHQGRNTAKRVLLNQVREEWRDKLT